MELKEYLARQSKRQVPHRHEESRIQIAVANYIKAKYPKVLFTIAPSGINLPVKIAARLKAMGYKAGTPDLLIFEPRGNCHGLFLELKTVEGKLSDYQREFLIQAEQRDYMAIVAKGYNEAISIIDLYFRED